MKRNYRLLFFLSFLLVPLSSMSVAEEGKVSSGSLSAVYLNESAGMEDRIEDALSRMTNEEKVEMCHGQGKFCTRGVPRLGIPELWWSDGPHGVRAEVKWNDWGPADWTSDYSTAFPALTCLAATFDPEISRAYGIAIGEEARYRKKEVLLGPGVNIYRHPMNGRNFEYMGEDPFLAGEMVVPYIQGVQDQGVAACVKHYMANNQEWDRMSVDVSMSDRALHEIYLPAFKRAVVDGKVWSLMGAYNRFRDEFCCHNDFLLNKVLKGDWGFDGVVVSDWGGVHDTYKAATGGLDVEMGTDRQKGDHLSTAFLKQVEEGKIPQSVLDDKARRILRLIFRTAMNTRRPWGSYATEAHADVGRAIGEAGIVLLKNDGGLFPLLASLASGQAAQGGEGATSGTPVKKILVVGENATRSMCLGGGSSELKTYREVSPLDGIKALAEKAGVECVHVPGYSSAKDADVVKLTAEALEAAKGADVVLFVGGLNKNGQQDSEGGDRKDYHLPYGQDALIEGLAKANPKTAVVLVSGNAVAMPWIEQVPSVVQMWYLGTEGGNALARVLFGEVNPSGKLPFTFPVKLEDNPAVAGGEDSYPGKKKDKGYREQEYVEDILVGYRFNDTKKVAPLFPFGHGLSYTSFALSDMKTDKQSYGIDEPVTVQLNVANTGKRAGAEVVQVYVEDVESSVLRPLKELKQFRKVKLEPGASEMVELVLSPEAFAFYDDKVGEWKTEPGEFRLHIGTSSADIREVLSLKKK